MSDFINNVTLAKHQNKQYPKFNSGDTVEVHVKVKEGEKERIQKFKGLVIKVQGSGMGKSFTVRKMSSGIGVERTFPFASPNIDKVDLIATGKVRKSRIYYIRKLFGKKARIESTLVTGAKTEGKKEEKPAATAE